MSTATTQPQRQAHPPQRPWYSLLLQDLLIGGIAGAIAKTATAPITRCLIIMQTQQAIPEIASGVFKPFSSSLEVYEFLVQNHGVESLFQGNAWNCIRYIPQQFSALMFNHAINSSFPTHDPKTDFWKAFGTKFVAGGLAGIVANVICAPFDYAHVHLATDLTGKSANWGWMDVFNNGGSILASFPWMALGAFAYRAGQLALFAQIQDLNPYKKERGLRGALSSFIAVTVARIAIMPLIYPLSTLTRQSTVSGKAVTLEEASNRSLFDGVMDDILRGIMGSIVIVAYDVVKAGMSRAAAHVEVQKR